MESKSTLPLLNNFSFLAELLYQKITAKEPIINTKRAKENCDAPIEIPTHIERSINAKLYGSFTAVLYLITDNAPTKPNDKAKEDLTTAINAATLIVIINKVFPNSDLEENVVEKRLKIYLKIIPANKEENKIESPSNKLNCNELVIKSFERIPSIKFYIYRITILIQDS